MYKAATKAIKSFIKLPFSFLIAKVFLVNLDSFSSLGSFSSLDSFSLVLVLGLA